MIVQPKVRGFMCTTAHPIGCAAHVKEQIAYVESKGKIENGPKRVLVIGSSTGYGLASRITAAFACDAQTIGVFFEKPAQGKRTASAGWYNSAAFHQEAESRGLYAKSFNGDAFSDEVKEKVIDLIKKDWGQVDLVVYSLASPRRQHPKTGELFSSTLKPIGQAVTQRGVNTDKEIVEEVTLEPASEEEISNTVAVMGGEDWEMWIDALSEAGVLAPDCKTTAYTYLGEKVTREVYWDGTIGAAKKDLDKTAIRLREKLNDQAYVSVLKAVVTQSSSAIPIMPLYLALLFKVMKADGTHEDCIEQIDGLFREGLYAADPQLDEEHRLRMDAKELRLEVQQVVEQQWAAVNSENLYQLTDFQGYKDGFLRLFGFGLEGVNYQQDVEVDVPIIGLIE